MNTIRGVNCEGLPTRRKRHSCEKASLSLSFSLSLPCWDGHSFIFTRHERASTSVDWAKFVNVFME